MSKSSQASLSVESLHATDISPHSHVVQFYTLHSALVTSLTRFVRSSLRAGDSVVVIATESHRRDVQARLRGEQVNLRQPSAQGRLKMLDAKTTLSAIMRKGMPDRERFVRTIEPIVTQARSNSKSNFQGVAAFGEMVTVLAAKGNVEGAILLERYWNEFARTTRLVLHCAYPIHLFAQPNSEDNYVRICREHTNVLPA